MKPNPNGSTAQEVSRSTDFRKVRRRVSPMFSLECDAGDETTDPCASRDAGGRCRLRSSTVEQVTGKRLGKCLCLIFALEIDPADIRVRDLPETDGLEPHVIEPCPHLAQFMGQVCGIDHYFDDVNPFIPSFGPGTP